MASTIAPSQITHVVIKLSIDSSFILTEFYNVDKFAFSWRTTDESKWPNHEVEYFDEQLKAWKGFIQFIGTQNDAIDYFNNKCTVNVDDNNLSTSAELFEVIEQLKSTQARMTAAEKKLSDVMFELNNLKNIVCPNVDPDGTIKSVGRHSIIVTKRQLRSAFREKTDLKGFCSLVYSVLGFTVEEKNKEGKTSFTKLDRIEQDKLNDLIEFFIDEKRLFEEKYPNLGRPNQKFSIKPETNQSTKLDAATSSTSWSELSDQDDSINQVSDASLDIESTKKRRKREEPVDERTLGPYLRKTLLKDKFSKKLSNKYFSLKKKSL